MAHGREEMTYLRRWVRRHTSRDALLSGLKTFIWVAPLTLLIWVYAEREQEKDLPAVPIVISVQSADPNRVVKLEKDITIMADLRGPRSSLEEAQAELERANESHAMRIDVPASYQNGFRDVYITQQIQNNPLFLDRGITVSKVFPQSVSVFIDSLTTKDVPIEVRPTDAALLSSRPVFTPATVKIRGPQQVLESAAGKNDLKIYADLSVLSEMQQPGTHENVTVPLVASAALQDEKLTLSQTTAKGSFEVKAADAKGTLNSLSVWIGGAPTVLDKVDVQLSKEVITNVNVIGPADVIAELTKPNSAMLSEARAWLIITREDRNNAGTTQSKKLRYELPKGVSVSPQDEARLFEFKLVNKASAG
jgi:hypothetical protein